MPRRTPYELRDERDNDLLRAYRLIISAPGRVSVNAAMAALAKCPASRFWVSEDRATSIAGRILRGAATGMSRNKTAMFTEIARRAAALMARHGLTLRQAVARVIQSPTPSFYLTPLSAQTLVARALRRRRKRRRQE